MLDIEYPNPIAGYTAKPHPLMNPIFLAVNDRPAACTALWMAVDATPGGQET